MTIHEFSLGSGTDVLDEAGGYDFCAAATEIDGSGVIEGILCRDVKSAFVIDGDVRVRAEGASGFHCASCGAPIASASSRAVSERVNAPNAFFHYS